MSFEEDLPEMRQRIASLLLSPICQLMNFRYRSCVVNGYQYRVIADHIRSGRIPILPRAGIGATAAYDPIHDTLYVANRFLLIPVSPILENDQATCVHELTHGVFDQQHLGRYMALDSEIVAFIAEAAYRIRIGSLTPEPTVNAARAVVSNYINSGRNVLSEDAVQSLRRALLNSPTYYEARNDEFESDGIGSH